MTEQVSEQPDDPAMRAAKRYVGRGGAVSEQCGHTLPRERDVNPMQSDVMAWHLKFGVVVGESVAIRRPELRANLIEEEARETVEAIRRGDLVEAIDGMCDVLYVVFGTAVEWGLNLQPFFDEVHRTNMLKTGGSTREDGKILKPEGWKPPRIAAVLEALKALDADRLKSTIDTLRGANARLEGEADQLRRALDGAVSGGCPRCGHGHQSGVESHPETPMLDDIGADWIHNHFNQLVRILKCGLKVSAEQEGK